MSPVSQGNVESIRKKRGNMNSEKPNMEDSKVMEFAQSVLAAIPARPLKPATKRLYELTGQLYYADAERALDTTSKRSYYLRKAALTYFATGKLRDAVQVGNAKDAAHALRVLARFTSGVTQSECAKEMPACPLLNPQRRASKRSSLRGLPANWRQVMLEAMRDSTVGPALLLMAATGVRPSEVVNGVAVTPIAGGARVVVQGTKTDREHGQPLRIFEVQSELAVLLAQGGERLIKVDRANQISVEAGRIGRKLFGCRGRASVSAYSLRHAFASDLKAAGMSGKVISAILGHAAEDTKKHYGHPRQARMPIRAELVHAARPVRSVRASTPSQKVTL